MKLITKELLKRFEKVGDQSEIENPVFIAKFFNPAGSQTWYASEYDPETKIAFGYVTGMIVDEWGSFSITELESINLPFGLKIERDIHFSEITFNDLMQKNQRLLELYKPKTDEQSLDRE